jgi:hypothetical protein
VKLHTDHYDEAVELVNDSLAAFMEVGSKHGTSYGLECLAAVAAGRNRADDAARLLACAEQLRDDIGLRLQPYEQALHDRTAAFANKALGDQVLARERESGRTMTLDEAGTYALDVCRVLAP